MKKLVFFICIIAFLQAYVLDNANDWCSDTNSQYDSFGIILSCPIGTKKIEQKSKISVRQIQLDCDGELFQKCCNCQSEEDLSFDAYKIRRNEFQKKTREEEQRYNDEVIREMKEDIQKRQEKIEKQAQQIEEERQRMEENKKKKEEEKKQWKTQFNDYCTSANGARQFFVNGNNIGCPKFTLDWEVSTINGKETYLCDDEAIGQNCTKQEEIKRQQKQYEDTLNSGIFQFKVFAMLALILIIY